MAKAIKNTDRLTLAEFIEQYRYGVKKPDGKQVSFREVAELLGEGIVSDNVVKWQMRGTIPTNENYRNALRSFFGISDLNAITRKELNRAISSYPNRVIGIAAAPVKPAANQVSDASMQVWASAFDKLGEACLSMARSIEILLEERNKR